MTDTTLAARLAALASEDPSFEDGARLIPTTDAFEAVLAEIDQCVLPASLRFDSNGATLNLVVSGRRLCAVPGAADALEPDDTQAIKAAAEAIVAFADAATSPLRLRDDDAPDDIGDASHRVSGAALAKAAGRVVIDPDAPFLDKVRLRIGDAATAWVSFDDDQRPTDGQGPKPVREKLNKAAKSQLAPFVANRKARCPSHAEPSLTVLAGALGDDLALALVETADAHLLIALPDAAIPDATQAFQITLA